MSAIASPSVKFPHQPVEIVQRPKPTSLTVKSVLLYVRKRIYNQLSECRSNVQPWTSEDSILISRKQTSRPPKERARLSLRLLPPHRAQSEKLSGTESGAWILSDQLSSRLRQMVTILGHSRIVLATCNPIYL